MQYAWFILAIIALFTFAGIFGQIADALTAQAAAWNRYFGDEKPEPWQKPDELSVPPDLEVDE